MNPSPSAAADAAHAPLPIAPDAPLPNRKILRSWILPFANKSTPRAIALLVSDYAIWAGLIALTVIAPSIWVKLIAGNVAGFWIGRLFILGHDACHQSFTPHRTLNKWLGRIAFLPSVTPYSVWEIGHNVVHHGQTNLKGFDTIWVPLSRTEYAALSPSRQRLERIYRSGWGVGLYYMVEMWWNKMFFPNAHHMPTRRPSFFWDSVLVGGFVLLWAAALVAAAIASDQSVCMTLLCGLAIPFLFWNTMIGFVVYLHHTHPRVSWYDNKTEWTRAQPFVSTTVHYRFGRLFDALLHQIMEHTAHHVDMTVPLYHLKAAQTRLEEMLPGRIVVEDFSWQRFFAIARLCKLYDCDTRTWFDFNGAQTAVSDSPLQGKEGHGSTEDSQ
jgi:omega-6 fatty acid desaturase (delta-12 desaturase)